MNDYIAAERERFTDGSGNLPAHGILTTAAEGGARSETYLERRGLRGEALHIKSRTGFAGLQQSQVRVVGSQVGVGQ